MLILDIDWKILHHVTVWEKKSWKNTVTFLYEEKTVSCIVNLKSEQRIFCFYIFLCAFVGFVNSNVSLWYFITAFQVLVSAFVFLIVFLLHSQT